MTRKKRNRKVPFIPPSACLMGSFFLLIQPEGGVRSGERFSAKVLSEVSKGSHNIPFGRWRDGLCNCCAFGLCHPLLCLTFFSNRAPWVKF